MIALGMSVSVPMAKAWPVRAESTVIVTVPVAGGPSFRTSPAPGLKMDGVNHVGLQSYKYGVFAYAKEIYAVGRTTILLMGAKYE